MSTTDYLIEVSVTISIIFLILFFIYYKYNSAKSEMDSVAEKNDYVDTGSYFRDKFGGKTKEIGIKPFLLNDSKSIGIRYIITSIIFFFIAGTFGVIMRVSLVEPTPTLFLNRTVIYDVLTTQHGILMIYMWALGSALGFSYYYLHSLKLKRIQWEATHLRHIGFTFWGQSSLSCQDHLQGGISILLCQ